MGNKSGKQKDKRATVTEEEQPQPKKGVKMRQKEDKNRKGDKEGKVKRNRPESAPVAGDGEINIYFSQFSMAKNASRDSKIIGGKAFEVNSF